MRQILAVLRAADAQPGDWYGWLTNQAAHMVLVGVPAALVLLFMGVPAWLAPILTAALYGLVWEVLAQRSKDVRDSLMDTAMVMAGACFVVALVRDATAAAVTFAIYAVFLALGVRERL